MIQVWTAFLEALLEKDAENLSKEESDDNQKCCLVHKWEGKSCLMLTSWENLCCREFIEILSKTFDDLEIKMFATESSSNLQFF